jgi:hypothetical protein
LQRLNARSPQQRRRITRALGAARNGTSSVGVTPSRVVVGTPEGDFARTDLRREGAEGSMDEGVPRGGGRGRGRGEGPREGFSRGGGRNGHRG